MHKSKDILIFKDAALECKCIENQSSIDVNDPVIEQKGLVHFCIGHKFRRKIHNF